jgi:peptide-methionine (S)-S-oxide reductase
MTKTDEKFETATLAAGCFWCVEAIFQEVKGVKKVVSGYTGGVKDNPSYQDVASQISGHAEALQITFDPRVISYKDILFIFFRMHDPTTLNQQGYDIGPEYRSAIFYHNEEQKRIADEAKKEAQTLYDDPIVTEITPASEFYIAEDYHHNFYKENKNPTYCRLVIDPKMTKLRQEFAKFLKKE